MIIYTAGYEGVSLEQFLERLHRTQVQIVVDVRDVPFSRKRGFSKTALATTLSSTGLEYLQLRELGCPKLIRDRYRTDGDWEGYTKAFMVHLRNQKAAISELAQICARARAALLCYEADPGQCHRTYVARVVSSVLGQRMKHIRAEGVIRDRAAA